MTDVVGSSTGNQKAPIKQRAWREEAKEEFAKYPGVITLSPYRGRDRSKKIKKVGSYLFTESNDLVRNSMSNMLLHRDYDDVRRADILLVNLTNTKNLRPSIGTLTEIAWAFSLKKPIICIVDESSNEHYYTHPFMQGMISQWVKSTKEGVQVIMEYWHPQAQSEV